jgi:MerR family transcriptional regulator/heat shock protein HspR
MSARRNGFVLIGEISRRYSIHPQTLRIYEREGLIKPDRTEGNTRLYGPDTIERLEIVLTLIRDLGVNLAGVEVILNMKERMESLQQKADRLLDYLRREADRQRREPEERYALVKLPPQKLEKK